MANKMNPEVKAQWVAALRSGQYRQAKESLRKNGNHCCLGVLCDLFAKGGGKSTWRKQDLNQVADGRAAITCDPDGELPGMAVCIWSSLDPDVHVDIGGDIKKLWQHNDDGATFAEIADAIEAQL